MNKKLITYLSIIVGLIVIVILLNLKQAENKKIEVRILDVGQGDASLIQTEAGQNILIDGGPNNKILQSLSEALPWSNQIIDLMILTHPHDDHVSGLIEVLNKYEVKKILYTGVSHNSPAYLAWLEKVKILKIPILIIDHPQTIKLDNKCDLDILFPLESLLNKEVENINNSSIVAKLDCGEKTILFMGDAEDKVENILLEKYDILNSNIIKIGHHGSNTSSTEEFLRTVMAEKAIISVGAKNMFGHPSQRVENRLERLNMQIYRTDILGTIEL